MGKLLELYCPAEGDRSKVRAGGNDAGLQVDSALSRSVGNTDNVLESAGCASFSDPTSA